MLTICARDTHYTEATPLKETMQKVKVILMSLESRTRVVRFHVSCLILRFFERFSVETQQGKHAHELTSAMDEGFKMEPVCLCDVLLV